MVCTAAPATAQCSAVRDQHTAPRAAQGCDPHREPSLAPGKPARIFFAKFVGFAGQDGPNAGGRALTAVEAPGRGVAEGRKVAAARIRQASFGGVALPGCVDGDDHAVFIEHDHLLRARIEEAQTEGFTFPQRLVVGLEPGAALREFRGVPSRVVQPPTCAL